MCPKQQDVSQPQALRAHLAQAIGLLLVLSVMCQGMVHGGGSRGCSGSFGKQASVSFDVIIS